MTYGEREKNKPRLVEHNTLSQPYSMKKASWPTYLYIYLHYPRPHFFFFLPYYLQHITHPALSFFTFSPRPRRQSICTARTSPPPPRRPSLGAVVPMSAQDSRGVAFTLAINPFQPVSASLPIGLLSLSLSWPPPGVGNIWFGVTTAVSSGLAI